MSDSPEVGSVRKRVALPAFKPNMAVLMPLAGATVFLLGGVFFAWQATQVLRVENAREALASARDRGAKALAASLAQTKAHVLDITNAAPVVGALANGLDDAGRAAALTALHQALPEARVVELFQPGMPEVLSADLRRFGYAKASQLLKAQSAGAAPLQSLQTGKSPRVLTVAVPIKSGERLLAFAWVELPIEPLLDVFRAGAPDDGRLELRQGNTGAVLLDGVGDGEKGELTEISIDVPDSLFRVVSMPPRVYLFGPENPYLFAVLAVLGLGFGSLMLWLRRVGMEEGMRRLRPKHKDDGDRTTLAEAIEKMPGPKPASARTSSPGRPRPAAPAALEGEAAPARTGSFKATAPVMVDRTIFRAYDIRGVVGVSLTPQVAHLIGRAIGSEAIERGLREIVVGRDGRLSGPDLSAALIEGLRESGCDVVDIGLAPTPLVYFATYSLNTGSGVAVTGSHNPPDYNGFKIVLGGETLAESAIQNLYARIAEGRFVEGQGGLQTLDVKADYLERVASDVQIDRRLKVVVDCGNGVPGAVAPALLEGIGAEVLPLYCDVDGTFPNHHPDPSEPANLRDLILTVKQMDADLGLAFDGDGDRLGVVTKGGEVIYPDRVLMLFAIDVLTRNPGASIIYDVKCTGHLQPMILKHGGSPIMWKTGHSLIKAKMRETDAELAGEMSGHSFFRERWYGFDDGLYAAARLLEILAGDLDGRSPEAIFAELPKGVSTPELKVPMQEGEHYRFVERFKERANFEGARVTTIDGVRADWPDGWGLVRASNTTPVLVLRFDADSEQALLRIQDTYRKQLLALDGSLKLPF
jgi:phosphomannomutase/phosphoglucomutase